jgi:DNA (cytosine-5)-methyltransferase 1
MLPSAVMLLPTPTATPYGNNQSASSGAAVRPSLDTLAPMLLPTPTAQLQHDSQTHRSGKRTEELLLGGIALAASRGDLTEPPSIAGNESSDE